MKLQTVNVIEYANDSISLIYSFSDDAEGNKEAEELFKEIAKKNGFDDCDIAVGLEDGFCEQGTFQVFIAHS